MYNPFTAPDAPGVITRYLTAGVSAGVTILGIIGLMDEQQRADVMAALPQINEAVKALVTAISGLIAVGVPAYAAVTKAMSERGLATAKASDALIPKSKDVEITTPEGEPNIIVPAKGA
mgnify:CR=1 FL=1